MSLLLMHLVTSLSANARTQRKAKRRASQVSMFARAASVRTSGLAGKRLTCCTLLDPDVEVLMLETTDTGDHAFPLAGAHGSETAIDADHLTGYPTVD